MNILYFTASWCQPCKVFGPIMEKVGEEFGNFQKISLEDEQAGRLVDEYQIFSVPTVVLVKDDLELDRRVGAQTFDNTKNWIEGYVSA